MHRGHPGRVIEHPAVIVITGLMAAGKSAVAEALAQLHLRHRLAALVADGYAEAGITAVVQDLYLGEDLRRFLGLLRHHPVYLAVLTPRPEVIEQRDRDRAKTGYGNWSISAFDTLLRRRTPRLGLWIYNSELSIQETVEAILTALPVARSGWHQPRSTPWKMLSPRDKGTYASGFR